MTVHCTGEPTGGMRNLYIHIIPEGEIRAEAARLERIHAQAFDVSGLSYDDLGRQVLVRDLRSVADDLGIQNYTAQWSYDGLSGNVEVAFDFGTDVEMVFFKLRVA